MEDRMIRIYSRQHRHVRFYVLEEDDFGDRTEVTKFLNGKEYIDCSESLIGPDVACKIRSGILRVALAPSE